jgi:transposase-like protein
VIRHNGRGRRIFSEAFKAWIIEQALQLGVSVASLAMHNQVNANQLRRWVLVHQRRAAPMPASSRPLPVTIQAEPTSPASPVLPSVRGLPTAGLEVHCGGAVVHVGPGADASTLRMVLGILRGEAR